ncbi:nucleobase cation symporter-1 family protein [Sporobolomyces koalae]|uniref:nucleobase cation symporter-1 family protein n=1 Tax=Sporobolomyces koalae TaxID=500713 RepID=UPI003176B414
MGLAQIARKLRVEQPEGSTFLSNNDLLPVPPEHRLWKAWNFWTFWIADSFNLNTFMIASSMVGAGLSWWQAWLCVIVGYSLAAGFLVLNAIPGGQYSIIFPAYVRASFGVFGGFWPVLQRAVMSCVWFGVQGWIGGEVTYTLLTAIFPSFARIHNSIPSSGTDTAHFVSFFIFSFISLFVIYLPIHSLRHFFTLKALVSPICGLALFGWCISKAGGAGDLIHKPSELGGSTLGWAFVANLMACLGNMATLIVNATDFASRSRRPSDVVLPNLIALPVCFSIVSLFGILIGSSSEVIFGEFVWSPQEIMSRFLLPSVDGVSASRATRAGVAIISIGFIIAQIGVNVAANSLSAGCDLASLFPAYMTIRRGGYVAALIGFVMCPWHLLSSSSNFTTYLSAFTVFLSSVAGVMTAHYWGASKQRIKTDDLYHFGPDGVYRYCYGFNLRAYGAYICGIAPNLPGFIGAVGGEASVAATRIYQLSWFVGFGVSALMYLGLCKLFPLPELSQEDCDTITLGPYANTQPNPSALYREKSNDATSSKKSSEGEGKVEQVV